MVHFYEERDPTFGSSHYDWGYFDKAAYHTGSMHFETKGLKETIIKLSKIYQGADEVIDKALNDCKKKANTIVSKNVRKVYSISASDLTLRKSGNSKIGEVSLERKTVRDPWGGSSSINNVFLKYEGRRLTNLHFHTEPNFLPTEKPYPIKVKIKKKKKTLKQKNGYNKPFLFENPKKKGDFLIGENKKGEYQKRKRYIISKERHKNYGPYKTPFMQVRRTVSLPEMIDNAVVYNNIQNDLGKVLNKTFQSRFDHHLSRVLK